MIRVSIDLHQLAQRRTGPLTRVLIGDAQPNRQLVGPRRTVPYIEEVGTTALMLNGVGGEIHGADVVAVDERALGERAVELRQELS